MHFKDRRRRFAVLPWYLCFYLELIPGTHLQEWPAMLIEHDRTEYRTISCHWCARWVSRPIGLVGNYFNILYIFFHVTTSERIILQFQIVMLIIIPVILFDVMVVTKCPHSRECPIFWHIAPKCLISMLFSLFSLRGRVRLWFMLWEHHISQNLFAYSMLLWDGISWRKQSWASMNPG